MYICTKCNNTSDEAINYCPICGTKMQEVVLNSIEPVAPTYAEPQVPAYASPEIYYTPAPIEKPSLAKKIVGMVLSIVSFSMSALTSLYVLMFLLSALDGESDMGIVSMVFTVIMAMFILPGSIIGISFSSKARNLGDTSKMSGVGKGLGLAGIIILAVCFICSLCACTAGI